ncbi:MAG: nuclear transport factor 2 family protein [Cyanobacteria bacterium HKST-UBA01]|nr:nuclear transport factor 2 family protein [Cyanobacteria bacterium HKST-UBA01]
MKNSRSKVSLILISLLGSWFCLPGQTEAEEAAPNPVKEKESKSTGSVVATSQDPLTYPFQPSNAEAQKVLSIIKEMATACINQDIDTIASHMHDHVTSINQRTNVVLSGKESVIEHIREMFKKYSPDGETPLISYDIKQPFIHVHGKEAIATYVAVAKIGGMHPAELRTKINEVFVKDGDQWQSIHYRSRWDHDSVPNSNSQNGQSQSQSKNKVEYKRLKGGIEVLLLNLSEIKALGNDIKSARQALKEIKTELSRRELLVNSADTIAEPVLVKSPDNFLAPRKRILNHAVEHLDTMLDALGISFQKYGDGSLKLVVREDIRKPAKEIVEHWPTHLRQAGKHRDSMEKLLKGPGIDNEAVIEVIKLLDGDLEKMEKDRQSLLLLFTRGGRSRSHSHSH